MTECVASAALAASAAAWEQGNATCRAWDCNSPTNRSILGAANFCDGLLACCPARRIPQTTDDASGASSSQGLICPPIERNSQRALFSYYTPG